MARFTFVAVFVAALAGAVSAAPIVARNAIVARAFTELPYAQFQISDGVAGDAQAKAEAVCVDPFAGQDLATIDSASFTALKNMRSAAEDAEGDLFNPAIDAASGAAADALQVGKIQNKVLKLTCLKQARQIELAQAQADGEDTADVQAKLADTEKKLATNIATDKKSAGKTSQGVA
ncbi:hypothetical protein AAF712_000566 [Marasmius tenuissimus]|uniref:Small secreted protein n=1 Tax=Marasmius tenuissimus TaxID=585030 RepID=A0ABR3AGV6_9AGAR|nr:hypothetical protein PM082_001441 [Marasmius tenuissimus]